MEKPEQIQWRIRSLRKKLRRIDDLQRADQPLNEEEKEVVSKKAFYRDNLTNLLTKNAESLHNTEAGDLKDVFNQHSIGIERIGDELKNEAKVDVEEQVDLSKKDQLLHETEEASSDDINVKFGVDRDERNAPLQGQTWVGRRFQVKELKGHNGLITAVAADGDLLISASTDTTIKVWNTATAIEVNSICGHTGPVYCLVLLPEEQSKELARYLDLQGQHRIIFSGGGDCCLNIWSATSGKLLKSVYTYHNVISLTYMASEVCVITGTESGKLEVWDAVSGMNLYSLFTYDDGVTSMKSSGFLLYTGTTDGIIKVWELENRELRPLFSIDEIDLDDHTDIVLRHIRSLDTKGDWIFYGDDGTNIKAINWKTGEVFKYINQVCESGSTDAVTVTPANQLISSSYDIDSGRGYINVRKIPEGDYLGSLNDNQSTRIHSLAYTTNSVGLAIIVTGGETLKVWQEIQYINKSEMDNTSVVVSEIPGYEASATLSEYESTDDSNSEMNDDKLREERFERMYMKTQVEEKSSFLDWCSVL